MTQKSGPIGISRRKAVAWLQLLPRPHVHADFAAAAALAAADEQRAAAMVEVGLAKRQRFCDPQPGAPQHDD
jgi:hypothetical protein